MGSAAGSAIKDFQDALDHQQLSSSKRGTERKEHQSPLPYSDRCLLSDFVDEPIKKRLYFTPEATSWKLGANP